MKKTRGVAAAMKQAVKNFDPKNREQAILTMVLPKKFPPDVHVCLLWA